MRPRSWAPVALIALLALAAIPANAAEVSPSRVLVSFDDLPDELGEGSIFHGARVMRVDPVLGFAVMEARQSDLASLDAGSFDVESDEPTLLLQTQPDDPMFGSQYGPQQVHAPGAWDTTVGSAATKLCVVDSGARMTHQDLAGARMLGGHDFVNDDDDPSDDNGHGTHVAGIAAASIGNDVGTSGIAEVGILVAKVMDDKGRGSPSAVASGIRWCSEKGARVITMSLGSAQPSPAIARAVEYAAGNGALLVAAAGNDGPCEDCVLYPAAFPEVIAVTCSDAAEAACKFSTSGGEAELAAPGHQILSTWNTGDDAYKSISGTSMSAPHVAGVAALVWSAAPDLTADELRSILDETARDLGAAGRDAAFGFGIVDAKAAVDRAAGRAPVAQPPANAPPANIAPPAPAAPLVARAGTDQRVTDADGSGFETVTLDASASSGAIASYEWGTGRTVLSTQATPTIELPVGSHSLRLTVRDAAGHTDTDRVRIVVLKGRTGEAHDLPSWMQG